MALRIRQGARSGREGGGGGKNERKGSKRSSMFSDIAPRNLLNADQTEGEESHADRSKGVRGGIGVEQWEWNFHYGRGCGSTHYLLNALLPKLVHYSRFMSHLNALPPHLVPRIAMALPIIH